MSANTDITFEPFPKIARLFRNCVVTEKLDGTNAQVIITDDGCVGAASRNRLITPGDDNYGFARWVEGNKDELLKLGPGRHFGEWWGNGIQRNYGLKEKRFSLFNVSRWSDNGVRPACCHVVPMVFEGRFHSDVVTGILSWMKLHGSHAAPGFMNPEGVIVWHGASRQLFKATLDNDALPKSLAVAAE